MIRNRGKLVVAALMTLVLAVGIVALATTPAQAIFIGGPGVTVYYNNAAHSTVIGARGTGCCGEIISWGSTSKYYTFERLYCLDVVCPIYA